MTTSCTDKTHPYYEKVSGLSLTNAVKFFTEHPERMRHVSLGEMLDFTCGAGMNFVSWNMPVQGLTEFIKKWMENQEQRVHHKRVPISEGVYKLEIDFTEEGYTWNRFSADFDEELPFINQERCPIEGHEGTGKDIAGRIHCIQRLPVSENGRETEDICYSIISDIGVYLPLERILTRLDVSGIRDNNYTSFPFSGFSLAGYIKAWHSQEGKRTFFMQGEDFESYRAFPDFRGFTSED